MYDSGREGAGGGHDGAFCIQSDQIIHRERMIVKFPCLLFGSVDKEKIKSE